MSKRKAWTGQGRIGHHVTKAAAPVLEILTGHFRLTEAQARDLLWMGAVYQGNRRAEPDDVVPAGGYLRLHLQPRRYPIQGVDWKKAVVAETKEYLVAEKPYGVPVHPTLDNARENVLACLRETTGRNLLVTQRLDVPVGGLMVLAKTDTFQRRYNRWLAEQRVHKVYAALTHGAPPVGRHVHYMENTERGPKRLVAEERPGWLRCELSVLSVTPAVAQAEGKALNEVHVALHTGRTHQIRVQLAALGAPILGDWLYGSRARLPFPTAGEAIGLFAARLWWNGADGGPFAESPPYELVPPWRR